MGHVLFLDTTAVEEEEEGAYEEDAKTNSSTDACLGGRRKICVSRSSGQG